MLIASMGCDGGVKARIKVVSSSGDGVPDALIRRDESGKFALEHFTNEKGCAGFSRVIGWERYIHVTVGRSGYQSLGLQLRSHAGGAQENCLLIHLARDGEGHKSSAETLALDGCPCGPDAGYYPRMTARFKVRATDATELEQVEVRRSNEPLYPWAHVTDSKGCVGVSWIVPASARRVPLVLEKQGYQRAYVEVPTMADRCYSVNLSGVDQRSPSTVAAVANDECECAMFSGKNTWPKR